jgi:hypothetical protein
MVLLQFEGSTMLQYLLSHPEYAFSPPETADLCEAFDMTIAALQERADPSQNWTDESMAAALSEEILAARMGGERDPRRLSDRALHLASGMREARRRA